jgi:hypothetical protein
MIGSRRFSGERVIQRVGPDAAWHCNPDSDPPDGRPRANAAASNPAKLPDPRPKTAAHRNRSKAVKTFIFLIKVHGTSTVVSLEFLNHGSDAPEFPGAAPGFLSGNGTRGTVVHGKATLTTVCTPQMSCRGNPAVVKRKKPISKDRQQDWTAREKSLLL